MANRIGFVSFSSEGHLNPSLTLARTLADRGHAVQFYCLADGIEKVQRAGFPVHCYAEDLFSITSITESYRRLGQLSGLAAVRHTLDAMSRRAAAGLRDLPALFQADQLDGLVVDQVAADAAAIARADAIPYITVCNALPVNLDRRVPPVFSHALPGAGLVNGIRTRVLNALADQLTRPLLKTLNRFQTQRGLPKFTEVSQLGSPLAQITQIPRAFDFPERRVDDHFHYTAPFHSANTRAATNFPWDRIDPSRPLVYASMGTLQNQIVDVFQAIAAACADLPVQLVVSFGGSTSEQDLPALAGDPIVVPYAPQLQLLDRAALCITHAGLNTALESLSRGLPMLAIPVTNDQPGVAARIASAKVGQTIRLRNVAATRLREAVHMLLEDPQYRANAAAMQREMAALDGPVMAAEIIEQALATNQRVRRQDDRQASDPRP